MKDLRRFQWKGLIIESPDDISEAINDIDNKDDGRMFVCRLANHLSPLDTTKEHINHACFLALAIDRGCNPHIIETVQSLWQ